MRNSTGPQSLRLARLALLPLGLVVLLSSSGCALTDWWHNGLKVGPNYEVPSAPVAEHWSADDPRIHTDPDQECCWWTVFHDPVLDQLIDTAYHNNLLLQKATAHLNEYRSQRNIAIGQLFPASQNLVFGTVHAQISDTLGNVSTSTSTSSTSSLSNFLNITAIGPFMSWDLDLWGKQRRGLESARADFQGTLDNYEDVLVVLLADVAENYIELRAYQQRLAAVAENREAQAKTVALAEDRLKRGFASELDVEEARANLAETERQMPPLRTGMMQANNHLCTLLGEPVHPLACCLESGLIPQAPVELAVGIPADLLRRRPDVRRAEREVASQCAQIGVAAADLYPDISVQGFLGYTSNSINKLFEAPSFTALVVPGLSWKILNYGRIINNVHVQDARLKQKALDYQAAVLKAGQQVEDALAAFLNDQEHVVHTGESVGP